MEHGRANHHAVSWGASSAMFLLLLIHLLIGSAILLSGDRLGRRAFAVAALAPLATIVWAATQWSTVVGDPSALDADGHASAGRRGSSRSAGSATSTSISSLRFDAFALVMTLLVSGIGLLVCIYAIGYFSHIKPGQSRLAGLMTFFAAAMLGVVWADHLIALFIAWELTSITSYLLIGNDDRNPRARAAALQAIFITGRRRTGAPARVDHHRPERRHVSAVGDDRVAAVRRSGRRRSRVRAARRVHEVGAGTVQQLAACRDGRADADQRLSPLGDDGQGRRVPRRAARADRCDDRQLATARARRRLGDDADRRTPRDASARSQAAARLRHHQPARVHDAAVRHRRVQDRPGRHRAAARSRRVQGDAVHARRASSTTRWGRVTSANCTASERAGCPSR